MGRTIILTEEQYRSYIGYLKEEKELIGESIQGIDKEYNLPSILHDIKAYLDGLFVKTDIIANNEYDLPTRKVRCAILKSELEQSGDKQRKFGDEELFYMLQDHFKGKFHSKEFRDEYLKIAVNNWFKGAIKDYNGYAIMPLKAV